MGSTRRLRRRLTRSLAVTAVAVGTAVTAIGAVGLGAAFADSPVPAPSTIQGAVSADGLTLTVWGDWKWARGSDCNTSRYATGWAVGWGDSASSFAVPSGKNGSAVTVGPTNAVFYYGSSAYRFPASLPSGYTGPATMPTARCGTYSAGMNSGTWGPNQYTYPASYAGRTVNVCAVTYDIHGTTAPKSQDLVATQNGDNSVKNGGNGGNVTGASADCGSFTLKGVTPGVSLVKQNNASGAWAKMGTASSAGAPVQYWLHITNTTSGTTEKVTALTDSWGISGPNTVGAVAPATVCANLIGSVLHAGDSLDCYFTLSAPAAGATLTDSAQVTVVAVDPGGNAMGPPVSATDTSTVTTPGSSPAVSVSITDNNDANGDGSYTKSETAPSAGSPVPYRAVVTNTSSVPVQILTLTDTLDGATANICATGGVLQPQQQYTCFFVAPAPAAGSSHTDVAQVQVGQVGNLGQTANAQDSSAVNVGTPPSHQLSINVVKGNDANQDGTYTQSEIAGSGLSAVPYQVTVTNTSQVPEQITSVTDTWPAGTGWPAGSDDLATASCPNNQSVVGTVLSPGQSITCRFSESVVPAANQGPLIDTVTVNAVDASSSASSAGTSGAGTSGAGTSAAGTSSSSGSATSVVFPAVLGTTIQNPTAPAVVSPAPAQTSTTPSALAFTGSRSPWVLATGSNLVAAGLLLLFVTGGGRRRGRRRPMGG